MMTYEITTKDFPTDQATNAFRVVFPANHYMTVGPFPEARFMTKAWKNHTQVPKSEDHEVTSEPVVIRHANLLDGGPHEPALIEATADRVVSHCNDSHELTDSSGR